MAKSLLSRAIQRARKTWNQEDTTETPGMQSAAYFMAPGTAAIMDILLGDKGRGGQSLTESVPGVSELESATELLRGRETLTGKELPGAEEYGMALGPGPKQLGNALNLALPGIAIGGVLKGVEKGLLSAVREALKRGERGATAEVVDDLVESLGGRFRGSISREFPTVYEAEGGISQGLFGEKMDLERALTRAPVYGREGRGRNVLVEAQELRKKAMEMIPVDIGAKEIGESFVDTQTKTGALTMARLMDQLNETVVSKPKVIMAPFPVENRKAAGIAYPAGNRIAVDVREGRLAQQLGVAGHEWGHQASWELEPETFAEVFEALGKGSRKETVEGLYPLSHKGYQRRAEYIQGNPNEIAAELMWRGALGNIEDVRLRELISIGAGRRGGGKLPAEEWVRGYSDLTKLPEKVKKPLRKAFKNPLFTTVGTLGLMEALQGEGE